MSYLIYCISNSYVFFSIFYVLFYNNKIALARGEFKGNIKTIRDTILLGDEAELHLEPYGRHSGWGKYYERLVVSCQCNKQESKALDKA